MRLAHKSGLVLDDKIYGAWLLGLIKGSSPFLGACPRCSCLSCSLIVSWRFFHSTDKHLLFFFFQSVLRCSVTVSTICRHSSRVVAFLQAVARSKFRGPRSASIVRSQVWLGLPAGRFQSGGILVGYTLQGLDGGPREVNCEQYGSQFTSRGPPSSPCSVYPSWGLPPSWGPAG